MGEGAAPRASRVLSGSPPRGGGRAPGRGPGSARVAAGGYAGHRALPVPSARHRGASPRAGRTGSLNFRVCVRGEGAPGGERFSRCAPSPPRSLPPRRPRAARPGGARGAEGALSARSGRRGGRSLMRDKRGGGGGAVCFFFNVLKTNSFRRAPSAPLPVAPPAPRGPHTPTWRASPNSAPGPRPPRRWNRTSSHVSRRPARPAPPPPRPAGPPCGARLPAAPAEGAGRCWRAGARAPGLVPRGRPWGVRSWFGARGVLLFFFLTARPAGSRAPKGAEALLGGRGGRQGPARSWHDRRAAILSPRLLSLRAGGEGGGRQSLAPSPRRAWTWRQLGEAAPAPSEALGGPMGVPSRGTGLGLCWGVAIARSFSCSPPFPVPHGAPPPPPLQRFALPPAKYHVLDVAKRGPEDEPITWCLFFPQNR